MLISSEANLAQRDLLLHNIRTLFEFIQEAQPAVISARGSSLCCKMQSYHGFLTDSTSVITTKTKDPLQHANMVSGAVPTFVRFDTCYPSPPVAGSDKGESQVCSPRTAAGTRSPIATREDSPFPNHVSPVSPAASGSREIAIPPALNHSQSSVHQTLHELPQARSVPSNREYSIAPSTDRSVVVSPSRPVFRPHVLVSCEPCKRAHVKCQQKRPCEHCVRRGISHDCINVIHKERGRPPKDPEKAKAKAAGRLEEQARLRTRSIIERQPPSIQPLQQKSYHDHQGYNTTTDSGLDRGLPSHRPSAAYAAHGTSRQIASQPAMPDDHASKSVQHEYFPTLATPRYSPQHMHYSSSASHALPNLYTTPASASSWPDQQTPAPYAYRRPFRPLNQIRPFSPPRRLAPLPAPPARYSLPIPKPAAIEPTRHADPSRNLRGIGLSRSQPSGFRPLLSAHERQSLQLPPLRISSVIDISICAVSRDRGTDQRYDRSLRHSHPSSAYPYTSTPVQVYHQAPAYYPQPTHDRNQHYNPYTARPEEPSQHQHHPEQSRYPALQEQRYHLQPEHGHPHKYEHPSERREAQLQRLPSPAGQDPRRHERSREIYSYSQPHSNDQASAAKSKTRTYNGRGSSPSSSESRTDPGQARKKLKKKEGRMEIAYMVH